MRFPKDAGKKRQSKEARTTEVELSPSLCGLMCDARLHPDGLYQSRKGRSNRLWSDRHQPLSKLLTSRLFLFAFWVSPVWCPTYVDPRQKTSSIETNDAITRHDWPDSEKRGISSRICVVRNRSGCNEESGQIGQSERPDTPMSHRLRTPMKVPHLVIVSHQPCIRQRSGPPLNISIQLLHGTKMANRCMCVDF